MSIYQIMSESPYISFFAIIVIAEFLVKIACRILRSINIAIRGWPPTHLDADGDFKSESPE